uniref:Retrotransposon protein, putative, Ty3-gypsy subclass n=1 Tax=Oryza sativa subsp. japonica TaxID=39947 RepID=Q2QRY5_ORYSJ|nr:retrotransposon protein, putative, Ty3-gypsy subclass [Oryza sativa Japonica Group]
MAALGHTALGRYRRREAKARVATGRGDTGDPFIGARRRRRRPTATGDAKETSVSVTWDREYHDLET